MLMVDYPELQENFLKNIYTKTDNHKDFIYNTFQKIEFFRDFEVPVFHKILYNLKQMVVEKGQIILKENDFTNYMIIL